MSNNMSNKQQALWQQGQRYTETKQWRQAAAAYEAIESSSQAGRKLRS